MVYLEFIDALVLWCVFGVLVPWCAGALMSWCCGVLVFRYHRCLGICLVVAICSGVFGVSVSRCLVGVLVSDWYLVGVSVFSWRFGFWLVSGWCVGMLVSWYCGVFNGVLLNVNLSEFI